MIPIGRSGIGSTDLRPRHVPATPQKVQQPASPPATGYPGISTFEAAAPAAAATPVSATAEARAIAAGNVETAQSAYTEARATVNRLNGHLEQALRTNPALQDPAAAERFRSAFMETHRDAYAHEGEAARALADSIRAAQPLLTAVPNPLPGEMDAPALLDKMSVARGLDVLAQSSEYAQAAQIAGEMKAGADPALPPQVADEIADRAALTGLREDLANGSSVPEALTRASTLLGAAGFVGRVPALSSLGNALAVGENVSEFIRTGDPARIGAAGFAALGAGGAAWAAVVGGGPITIGVAAVAVTGKVIFEQIANHNDYRRDTDPAIERAFGVTRRDLDGFEDEAQAQALAEFAASSPELAAAQRIGGGVWTGAIMDNAAALEARIAEILSARMAALPG